MAERRVINGYIVERQADGSLVTIGPAGGTAPQMPADPTFPYEGPKAGADLTGKNLTNTGQAINNKVDAATADARIRKAMADAAAAEAAAETARKGPVGAELQKARAAQVQAARGLHNQLDRVEGIYDDKFRNNGIFSVAEFNPFSGDNAQLDAAANVLMPFVKPLARTPGEGATDKSEYQDYRDLLPSGTSFDTTNDERILGLREMANSILRENGLPEYNRPTAGSDTMPPQEQEDNPMAVAGNPQGPDQADRSNVYLGDAPEPNRGGYAPYGAQYRTVDNPALAGVNAAIGKMIAQGASREQIAAFAASKGVTLPPDTKWGQETPAGRAWLKQNPGKPYPVNVDDMVVPMSGFEQFRNNAPQTKVGTALATAGNAGGFGVPQMLAGSEGLDYLRSQEPEAAFAGDVAGVIGGTAALGRAGGAVAGRVAPSLLGGGAKAAARRQLATDAAYGGIYGGATEGTPEGALVGAGTALLGSGLGMGVGRGLQKTFEGGGDLAAQALRERGIPLTVGQALGGLPKRLEDAATSIPIIGDVINARRGEGLQAFNRAAFEDAGRPIGATVDDIGDAGMDALRPQTSRAYDRATDGVTVPLDPRYAQELAPSLQQGASLTGDYGAGFARMVNNRVKPALDTGELTGANYQNMMRAMRDSRGSVKGQPFAEDYIEPVRAMEDATRGLMERQGGESVVTGLRMADDAYRNQKVLEKAIEASRNGTRSGEVGVFTPSQLNDASVANARKFGGTGATENRPFYDLATQGQSVLPSKLGDSGTPMRMFAGAGLLGAGTGIPAYSGADASTVAAPVGITAAAALLGTKAGQKALVKAIMDRKASTRALGGMFGRRKAQKALSAAGAGLGVGALPYIVE